MPDKNQAARGPQKSPFNLRAKIGVLEWSGMIPDANPATIPEHNLRKLVNGRYRGGGVIPRGGQAKVNTDPFQGSGACVDGIFDFQIGTKKALYVLGDGCPGISTSAGFSVGWAEFHLLPPFQPLSYYDTSSVAIKAAVFGSDLYIALDNTVRRLQSIDPPYGQKMIDVSGINQEILLLTLTGFTRIPAVMSFDGQLFMAADAGAGASQVIAWDGTTQRADLTAINAGTGFGLWRDNLILGFAGAPNHIRIRARGASPGTWATVAPGAGTVLFKSGISYRDNFYFTSGGREVWQYDGTTLAIFKTFGVGVTTHSIEVHNGFLFVSYTLAATAKIAKYDGIANVWTDVEKDLTAQAADVIGAGPLADYRQSLWIGVTTATAHGRLYASPTTDTSGTYLSQPLNAGGLNGEVQQLVVF